MQKIGLVKILSVGFDKESAEITDKLEAHGYKIASVLRQLLKEHANEFLKGA